MSIITNFFNFLIKYRFAKYLANIEPKTNISRILGYVNIDNKEKRILLTIATWIDEGFPHKEIGRMLSNRILKECEKNYLYGNIYILSRIYLCDDDLYHMSSLNKEKILKNYQNTCYIDSPFCTFYVSNENKEYKITYRDFFMYFDPQFHDKLLKIQQIKRFSRFLFHDCEKSFSKIRDKEKAENDFHPSKLEAILSTLSNENLDPDELFTKLNK